MGATASLPRRRSVPGNLDVSIVFLTRARRGRSFQGESRHAPCEIRDGRH